MGTDDGVIWEQVCYECGCDTGADDILMQVWYRDGCIYGMIKGLL